MESRYRVEIENLDDSKHELDAAYAQGKKNQVDSGNSTHKGTARQKPPKSQGSSQTLRPSERTRTKNILPLDYVYQVLSSQKLLTTYFFMIRIRVRDPGT